MEGASLWAPHALPIVWHIQILVHGLILYVTSIHHGILVVVNLLLAWYDFQLLLEYLLLRIVLLLLNRTHIHAILVLVALVYLLLSIHQLVVVSLAEVELQALLMSQVMRLFGLIELSLNGLLP